MAKFINSFSFQFHSQQTRLVFILCFRTFSNFRVKEKLDFCVKFQCDLDNSMTLEVMLQLTSSQNYTIFRKSSPSFNFIINFSIFFNNFFKVKIKYQNSQISSLWLFLMNSMFTFFLCVNQHQTRGTRKEKF